MSADERVRVANAIKSFNDAQEEILTVAVIGKDRFEANKAEEVEFKQVVEDLKKELMAVRGEPLKMQAIMMTTQAVAQQVFTIHKLSECRTMREMSDKMAAMNPAHKLAMMRLKALQIISGPPGAYARCLTV